MFRELLNQIFSRHAKPSSRSQAKQRLKLILAHDRTTLSPEALQAMQQEILAVVSKYVELDADSLEFSLASEQGTTALIANLPIRRVRTLNPDPASQSSY